MRKKYRKTAAVLLTAAMLAGGTRVSAEESAEVKLKDGQRMATIQVVSIVGNELTYYEVEEETEETEESTEEKAEETTEEKAEETTEEKAEETTKEKAEETTGEKAEETTGEKAEETTEENTEQDSSAASSQTQGNAPQGQMPDGNFDPSQTQGNAPQGQMPDGNFDPSQMQGDASQGQMPGENFDPSQMTEGTSGAGQTDNASGKSGSGKAAMPGNIETTTVYLPVAVTVHTDIGEKKTFSILEAGDELEVLLQEDEEGGEMIIEIWMNGEEGTSE